MASAFTILLQFAGWTGCEILLYAGRHQIQRQPFQPSVLFNVQAGGRLRAQHHHRQCALVVYIINTVTFPAQRLHRSVLILESKMVRSRGLEQES
jgi:hypothetical protein